MNVVICMKVCVVIVGVCNVQHSVFHILTY
jgi:hypothetical protein